MSTTPEPLPDLLPCRKCGKLPMTERIEDIFSDEDSTYAVYCFGCKIDSESCGSEIAAFKKWNRLNAP